MSVTVSDIHAPHKTRPLLLVQRHVYTINQALPCDVGRSCTAAGDERSRKNYIPSLTRMLVMDRW